MTRARSDHAMLILQKMQNNSYLTPTHSFQLQHTLQILMFWFALSHTEADPQTLEESFTKKGTMDKIELLTV